MVDKNVIKGLVIMSVGMSVLFGAPSYIMANDTVSLEENIDSFVIENGILTGYTGTDAVVTIPSGVSKIGEDAFSGNGYVKEIILTDEVTEIGAYSFYECSNLTKLTVPNGDCVVGNYAFSLVADGFTIYGNMNSAIYQYAMENDIPFVSLGVTQDGFVIKDGVLVSYEGNASDVVVPDSVRVIGEYAFSNCNALEEIVIPESVIKIGGRSFGGCNKLTEIYVPAKVANIYSGAFSRCDALEKVVVSENNPYYESVDGVLFSENKTTLICYPASKYDKDYMIPNTVNTLSEYAFDSCNNLKFVFIPERVTRIEGWTFSNCSYLRLVFIPKSVTYICNYAFESSRNLLDVYYDGTEYEWKRIERSMWISVMGYAPLSYAKINAGCYNRELFQELANSDKWDKNGIYKAEDEKLYYYKEGEINTKYTGFAEYEGEKW